MQLGILHSSLSLSLVARGIVGERRGLESGVSGNAALKIDKRLRVVDQSGAFRCYPRRRSCPGSRGARCLRPRKTPAISLKLHTQCPSSSSSSPFYRLGASPLVEEITRTIRLIVQGRVLNSRTRLSSRLASSIRPLPAYTHTHTRTQYHVRFTFVWLSLAILWILT